jgi:hypothetical protein
MSTTLGQLKPHWLGDVLGTNFMEFDTPTVQGLAREDGDRVEILAIYSKEQGRGYFRDFIARCKGEFREVRVLTIMEPQVAKALKRYGFRKFQRREPDGERVAGMVWKRQ